MSAFEETTSTLKGSVILASPALIDPCFLQTVLLLTEHSEEAGAVGYVINRPLGKKVSDLLDEKNLGHLGEIPIYLGGPVATDHLTFAAIGWDEEAGTLQVSTHLSLAGARHAHDEGFEVRAFVGYAGWSEGQLEDELEEDSWIVEMATREILQLEPDESMWGRILNELGPMNRLMSQCPPNPSLN